MAKLVDLNKTYAYFNERYFANKLPKVPVVLVSKLPGDAPNGMGATRFGRSNNPEKIYLNSALKKWPDVIIFTLLHEMAHVSLNSSGDRDRVHGRVWQAIMHRLSDDGAFEQVW